MPGEGISSFRGERLRAARARAGLTQKQLADRLRISQSEVSDWERGEVNPRARHLRAAADLLEVPVTEFVDADGSPTLRQLRQLAGLSQREVAAALQVSQQAYNRLERGGVVLRPETAAVLAARFGVGADEVLAAWRRAR